VCFDDRRNIGVKNIYLNPSPCLTHFTLGNTVIIIIIDNKNGNNELKTKR